MKIVFVTNGVLFHQAYFCSCINRIPDVDFLCVMTYPNDGNEQKARLEKHLEFRFPVLNALESRANWELARSAISSADLCLVGAENHKILDGIDRIYVRYSEHIFKERLWFLNPKTYLRFPKLRAIYSEESKRSWLLCASSHAKFDYNFYGLYKNKCLKFGYFPKANVGVDLSEKRFPSTTNSEVRILFAGRSVRWKHPEMAFYVLKKLRSFGLNCHLTFVSLPSRLRSSILRKFSYLIGEGHVTIIDELAPKKMMDLMAASHIFIFPSDNGEGFGATLYEAMSSKTAVIANKLAGATDLLVNDGVNGFVYQNKQKLNEILRRIAQNPRIIESVAARAKEFVDTHYSADVAAQNLLEFAKSGYTKDFKFGEPLSKM